MEGASFNVPLDCYQPDFQLAVVLLGRGEMTNFAKRQTPPTEEVRQRIEALKQRPVPAQAPKLFQFDPAEQFRSQPKSEKTGSEQS